MYTPFIFTEAKIKRMYTMRYKFVERQERCVVLLD
jgi:hypothetical protein